MFEVSISAHAGRVVVGVSGDVDMLTAGRLRESLAEAVRTAGAGPVIVDLSQVPFLDSSGIRALLDGYNTAMVAGGTLTVRGAHGTVARVLEVVGVDQALGVGTVDGEPLDAAPATPAPVDSDKEPRPAELKQPGSS